MKIVKRQGEFRPLQIKAHVPYPFSYNCQQFFFCGKLSYPLKRYHAASAFPFGKNYAAACDCQCASEVRHPDWQEKCGEMKARRSARERERGEGTIGTDFTHRERECVCKTETETA